MIYTLFGGKQDLVHSVYLAKSEELAQQFRSIDRENPLERIKAYGYAYRDFMLDHSDLFDTIFSLSRNQDESVSETPIPRTKIMDFFERAIEDCKDRGILSESVDTTELTEALWAAANGVLQMEILDMFPDEETARSRYKMVTAGILNGYSSES
jgi:AcrR family transcriptional regulator